MKRIVILLSVLLVFITGCSVTRLDNKTMDESIDVILSDKQKNYNVNFDGYKYYVPNGLEFLNKDEYNALLKDTNNNKYYLYVDAISYYHKIDIDFSKDNDSYYYKELNYNKKKGYIQVLSSGKDNYYIKMIFNYARLEAYASNNDLGSVVNNMCYILRSIKFNDKVLESLIGDNVLSYKEENYTLFETESSQEDFLDVVSKYDPEFSKAKDQDNIDINDD